LLLKRANIFLKQFWVVFFKGVHERAGLIGMEIAVVVQDCLAHLPELV